MLLNMKHIYIEDESIDLNRINPVITVEDESIDPETHWVVLYESKPVIPI